MRILLTILLSVFSVAAISQTAEHVLVTNKPVQVVLPVGDEKIITFGQDVQLGLDRNQLPESTLQVLIVGKSAYLKANADFKKQRILAKLESGQVMILDLQANLKGTPNELIVLQEKTKQHGTNPQNDDVDAVTLTRFAVQQLYAPKRLLSNPHQIMRTAMHTNKSITLFDARTKALPLAQWQYGSLYVTALKIKNLTNLPVQLDPRIIIGDFKAATLYPKTSLTPVTQPGDSTTLFLVASKPFENARGQSHV